MYEVSITFSVVIDTYDLWGVKHAWPANAPLVVGTYEDVSDARRVAASWIGCENVTEVTVTRG